MTHFDGPQTLRTDGFGFRLFLIASNAFSAQGKHFTKAMTVLPRLQLVHAFSALVNALHHGYDRSSAASACA